MSPIEVHARAVARFEDGQAAEAIALLRDAVTERLDPELVNDLAVMLAGTGDADAARSLLSALGTLAPGYRDARENLAALGATGGDAAPAAAPAVDAERRARFLQVVAEGQRTHLADNVDFLFEPWGRELPDPAGEGERLAEQLAVLDRCDVLWDGLGDDASRELFLRFLAYRALGPAHVRLQLDPVEYRRSVIALTAQLVREVAVLGMPGMPYEWAHHVYDFSPIGVPLRLAGPPLPLASTLAFSQYAYRDESVPARPQPGDVALDVGGCWGETALWLADQVGPAGHVHSFEPSPSNRRLLADNLARNAGLVARITVHAAPLADEPGREVWMDDATAAAATTHADPSAASAAGRTVVPALTETVDALVAQGAIERVDFLKLDVEGAELDVLRGAAQTLRAQRPRLAFATYHKPDDLAVLPSFVASLGLAYRWYLQCSTMTDVDTILFGVPA